MDGLILPKFHAIVVLSGCLLLGGCATCNCTATIDCFGDVEDRIYVCEHGGCEPGDKGHTGLCVDKTDSSTTPDETTAN